MPLRAGLSSYDRCVNYNANNLIMVLNSSLKREPTQITTFRRLGICLKSRFRNSRVTETFNNENVARIKNFCYCAC